MALARLEVHGHMLHLANLLPQRLCGVRQLLGGVVTKVRPWVVPDVAVGELHMDLCSLEEGGAVEEEASAGRSEVKETEQVQGMSFDMVDSLFQECSENPAGHHRPTLQHEDPCPGSPPPSSSLPPVLR